MMRLSYIVPTQYVIPKSASIRAAKVLFKILDTASAYADLDGYEPLTLFLARHGNPILTAFSQGTKAIPGLPTSRAPVLPAWDMPPAWSTPQGEQHGVSREHAHNDWPRRWVAPAGVNCQFFLTSALTHLFVASIFPHLTFVSPHL